MSAGRREGGVGRPAGGAGAVRSPRTSRGGVGGTPGSGEGRWGESPALRQREGLVGARTPRAKLEGYFRTPPLTAAQREARDNVELRRGSFDTPVRLQRDWIVSLLEGAADRAGVDRAAASAGDAAGGRGAEEEEKLERLQASGVERVAASSAVGRDRYGVPVLSAKDTSWEEQRRMGPPPKERVASWQTGVALAPWERATEASVVVKRETASLVSSLREGIAQSLERDVRTNVDLRQQILRLEAALAASASVASARMASLRSRLSNGTIRQVSADAEADAGGPTDSLHDSLRALDSVLGDLDTEGRGNLRILHAAKRAIAALDAAFEARRAAEVDLLQGVGLGAAAAAAAATSSSPSRDVRELAATGVQTDADEGARGAQEGGETKAEAAESAESLSPERLLQVLRGGSSTAQASHGTQTDAPWMLAVRRASQGGAPDALRAQLPPRGPLLVPIGVVERALGSSDESVVRACAEARDAPDLVLAGALRFGDGDGDGDESGGGDGAAAQGPASATMQGLRGALEEAAALLGAEGACRSVGEALQKVARQRGSSARELLEYAAARRVWEWSEATAALLLGLRGPGCVCTTDTVPFAHCACGSAAAAPPAAFDVLRAVRRAVRAAEACDRQQGAWDGAAAALDLLARGGVVGPPPDLALDAAAAALVSQGPEATGAVGGAGGGGGGGGGGVDGVTPAGPLHGAGLGRAHAQTELGRANVETELGRANVETELDRGNVETELGRANVEAELGRTNLGRALGPVYAETDLGRAHWLGLGLLQGDSHLAASLPHGVDVFCAPIFPATRSAALVAARRRRDSSAPLPTPSSAAPRLPRVVLDAPPRPVPAFALALAPLDEGEADADADGDDERDGAAGQGGGGGRTAQPPPAMTWGAWDDPSRGAFFLPPAPLAVSRCPAPGPPAAPAAARAAPVPARWMSLRNALRVVADLAGPLLARDAARATPWTWPRGADDALASLPDDVRAALQRASQSAWSDDDSVQSSARLDLQFAQLALATHAVAAVAASPTDTAPASVRLAEAPGADGALSEPLVRAALTSLRAASVMLARDPTGAPAETLRRRALTAWARARYAAEDSLGGASSSAGSALNPSGNLALVALERVVDATARAIGSRAADDVVQAWNVGGATTLSADEVVEGVSALDLQHGLERWEVVRMAAWLVPRPGRRAVPEIARDLPVLLHWRPVVPCEAVVATATDLFLRHARRQERRWRAAFEAADLETHRGARLGALDAPALSSLLTGAATRPPVALDDAVRARLEAPLPAPTCSAPVALLGSVSALADALATSLRSSPADSSEVSAPERAQAFSPRLPFRALAAELRRHNVCVPPPLVEDVAHVAATWEQRARAQLRVRTVTPSPSPSPAPAARTLADQKPPSPPQMSPATVTISRRDPLMRRRLRAHILGVVFAQALHPRPAPASSPPPLPSSLTPTPTPADAVRLQDEDGDGGGGGGGGGGGAAQPILPTVLSLLRPHEMEELGEIALRRFRFRVAPAADEGHGPAADDSSAGSEPPHRGTRLDAPAATPPPTTGSRRFPNTHVDTRPAQGITGLQPDRFFHAPLAAPPRRPVEPPASPVRAVAAHASPRHAMVRFSDQGVQLVDPAHDTLRTNTAAPHPRSPSRALLLVPSDTG